MSKLDEFQSNLPDQGCVSIAPTSSIRIWPPFFLINKKNLQKDIVEKHGKRLLVPQWQYKNFKIWGLTAMITTNFLNICFNTNIGVEEG